MRMKNLLLLTYAAYGRQKPVQVEPGKATMERVCSVESGVYLEDLSSGLQQTLVAAYGLTTGPLRCKSELRPKMLTQSSEKSLLMHFWFLLFKRRQAVMQNVWMIP